MTFYYSSKKVLPFTKKCPCKLLNLQKELVFGQFFEHYCNIQNSSPVLKGSLTVQVLCSTEQWSSMVKQNKLCFFSMLMLSNMIYFFCPLSRVSIHIQCCLTFLIWYCPCMMLWCCWRSSNTIMAH